MKAACRKNRAHDHGVSTEAKLCHANYRCVHCRVIRMRTHVHARMYVRMYVHMCIYMYIY